MTSRRSCIHRSLTDVSGFVAYIHEPRDFADRLDSNHGQFSHVDTFVLVLTQVKFFVRVLAKQVPDLFIVYFEERGSNQELLVRIRLIIQEPVDVVESVRDYSSVFWRLQPCHRVRLAAASLPICKDGPVVARERRLNEWKSCLIVNLALRRIHSIHFVVGKQPLIGTAFLCTNVSEGDLFLFLIHMNDLSVLCEEKR